MASSPDAALGHRRKRPSTEAQANEGRGRRQSQIQNELAAAAASARNASSAGAAAAQPRRHQGSAEAGKRPAPSSWPPRPPSRRPNSSTSFSAHQGPRRRPAPRAARPSASSSSSNARCTKDRWSARSPGPDLHPGRQPRRRRSPCPGRRRRHQSSIRKGLEGRVQGQRLQRRGQPIFEGESRRFAPSPATSKGAVYYDTVIEVENRRDPTTGEWQLRPGMTTAIGHRPPRAQGRLRAMPGPPYNFTLEEAYQNEAARARVTAWKSTPTPPTGRPCGSGTPPNASPSRSSCIGGVRSTARA